MGFEITYYFHPKMDDGKYNMEVIEEKKYKVGKPFDDTTYQKAASHILNQLTRRDILVSDVKVDELVKKSVSFKECKDGMGIVLKGKRYSLSDLSGVDCVDESAYEDPTTGSMCHKENPMVDNRFYDIQNDYQEKFQPEYVAPRQQATPRQGLPPYIPPKANGGHGSSAVQRAKKPLVNSKKRYTFKPYPDQREIIRGMKLRLTEGRTYEVNNVIESGPVTKLELVDDAGVIIKVSDIYFEMESDSLMYPGLVDDGVADKLMGSNDREIKLSFVDEWK